MGQRKYKRTQTEQSILKHFLYFVKTNKTWAGFMGIWPVQSPRAMSSEGTCTSFNALLYHPEILNSIFTFVFCRWSLTGHWSISMSNRDALICIVCHPSLLPHLHIAFTTAREIPVDLWCVGIQQDPEWVQGKELYLWLSTQGCWQPREATLSFPTRICFQYREKAMPL